MPGARLEIAELLISHLVEFAEQLDDLIVGLAIIDRNVVAGAVAHRSPDDVDLVLGEDVAGVFQVHDVGELERDVVHAGARIAHEIHCVVIRITAHEDEIIADPIRHPKPKQAAVEIEDLLQVRRKIGEMAELGGRDALGLRPVAERIPSREQLDLRAFRVTERQRLGDTGSRVIAALAANPVLVELARGVVKVGARRDFEGELAASCCAASTQLDREMPELAGEIAPVPILGSRHEADHIGVVVAQPLDVRRFEYGVSYPARFDHRFLRYTSIIAQRERCGRKTAMRLRGRFGLVGI